ncbi:MAG: AIR synthase family protein [Candidatus Brocadiia bacterium]
MTLGPGKLDADLLRELLESNVLRDERVAIRPGVGRDVCAIRMGSRYLVAKTDPITFATDRIGWYVVHVNANDLATVGARPSWFLVTALLPAGAADEESVREIWDDLQDALRRVDCALVGGHTEVTTAVERPVLVGHMLGEVECDRLVDKASLSPGDRILLAGGVPIEGTAIMAREKRGELADHFPESVLREAAGYLDDPGISVLRQAMAAVEAGAVHAMHDPTEGGVTTALWELAEASGCGLRVQEADIPILDPGRAFCEHFGIDPLGTISSGSLLICAPPADAEHIAAAVRDAGTPCAEIGGVRPPEEGVVLLRPDGPTPMPRFDQDEIARLFD